MTKYIDITSTIQVIGCIFKTPQLLDYTDKYSITDHDFPNEFHRIVFGSIFKIYELGAQTITIENIVDFLSTRPTAKDVFEKENGAEWLTKVEAAAIPSAFDYYYNRLKKFSLLRAYSESLRLDVSDLYDPNNIMDIKKKEAQEAWLDNSSLVEIANKIDAKIDAIKADYISNSDGQTRMVKEGLKELKERLKEYPEAGLPLYGKFINTITRGARLKKFYLRSAPTGVGKTRSLIADACYIACSQMFEPGQGWVNIGVSEPVVYITTEQDLEEIQTMMIAFLSNVNEEKILEGKYSGDEESRVDYAIEILLNSPIYIEILPDFSLQDVEDRIKRNIRDHDVSYVFHDYIHSSLKILEEITRRSGGVKLREDNVLFMLSIRLKDICNKYGVFIESATQLNADYVEAKTPDQNLLRGAKSIADKIDYGSVLLPVTSDDLERLKPIIAAHSFEKPSIKLSIYKNRRGRYKGIYLWCSADLGTCRINPMFCTSYTYEFMPIDETKITVEESAF